MSGMPYRARVFATSRSVSASGRRHMNDDRARDALNLAERALDAAMVDGVTEAEALVIAEDEALTRFANSQIHQNVAEIDVTVNPPCTSGSEVGTNRRR